MMPPFFNRCDDTVSMAKYICTVCGEIYDEEKEGVKFEDLPDDWTCPKCRAKKSVFMPYMETGKKGDRQFSPKDLEIDPDLVLHDNGVMDDIHAMADSGRSASAAMDTLLPVQKFDDILNLPEEAKARMKNEVRVMAKRAAEGAARHEKGRG